MDVHEHGVFMQLGVLLQLNVWMLHDVPAFKDIQATGRRCGVFTASVFFPLSCFCVVSSSRALTQFKDTRTVSNKMNQLATVVGFNH